MKGFALLFSILFLLLLTLFGVTLLVVAEQYYASTTHLFENQNARMTCQQAALQMIDRHNLEDPIFFDPWPNLNLPPFGYNGYAISASLNTPWNSSLPNFLTVSATKGPYHAEEQLQVSQRRFETFALYSDEAALLAGNSLIDGPVFVRESLELSDPGVEFREAVQASIFPENYATLRKHAPPALEYPRLTDLLSIGVLSTEAKSNGLVVSGKNPLFWVKDHYELDLDQLQLRQKRKKWEFVYRGSLIGSSTQLILFFDAALHVFQADHAVPTLSIKPLVPFYMISTAGVQLSTNLYTMESASFLHPLCLVSGGAFQFISGVPRAMIIHACLLALGSQEQGGRQVSLLIDAGSNVTSAAQKQALIDEMRRSTFILEERLFQAAATAVQNDERVIWIRGGLILASDLSLSSDVKQLHLQASEAAYPLLPALPFVYRMEGSQQWR